MANTFDHIFENFTNLMELLRNPQFKTLLKDYKRAKKAFYIGYEVQDEVNSQTLFTVGEDSLRPEDYLQAFSKFVKQKEAEIEAISILLNRPRNWNTSALNGLKKSLKENQFEEAHLRAAHKLVYHKSMVDVISMIKHAARETEPLLSLEERVNKAIEMVTHGKELTMEQQQWMGYIREHLKQNITLDENDLKESPVFVDRGGLARFKKVFPENHAQLIKEINEAIAA